MAPTNKDSGATNGRRAHVPGGTTSGARYARPSGDSRLSEEASALSAARGYSAARTNLVVVDDNSCLISE
jgi:hypothetical protein